MRRHHAGRARARAQIALVACALWVLGFELVPLVHVALHEYLAPHRHEGGVIVAIETEDRDAEIDEHAAPGLPATRDDTGTPQPARHAPDPHARLARALAHAHGSLAHHDLAVTAPAVPMHAPLPVDRRPSSSAVVVIATPISATVPSAAARGPPARGVR